MQTRNRLKPQHEAVKQLLKKYPQFVKINKTRKSGYPEIRLRDSIKKASITRKKKSKLT